MFLLPQQKDAAERMQDISVEAMEATYSALRPKSLGIADLGCSSGSNTLRYMKMLVGAVESVTAGQAALPEFRLCLNDLPTNDFNTLFEALPNFYQELKKGRNNLSVLVAAYPGSFYGRISPEKSLHFVFSFSSLHWLSRVMSSFWISYFFLVRLTVHMILVVEGLHDL